jgi:hypothetical protein
VTSGAEISLKFEFISVLLLKIQVFWDVTLFDLKTTTGVSKDGNAFIFRVQESNNSQVETTMITQKSATIYQ